MSRPDVSGDWRRDLSCGMLKFGAPLEITLAIRHRDPHFILETGALEAAGAVRTGRFSRRTNGVGFASQIGGAQVTCEAVWDGRELTICSHVQYAAKEVDLTDAWSPCPGGAELLMEHRSGVLVGPRSLLTRIQPSTPTERIDA